MIPELTPEIEIKNRLSNKNAILIFIAYFLLFFISSSLIRVIVRNIDRAIEPYTEVNQIIDELQLNYGVSYMDKATFDALSADDKNKIDAIELDEHYYLIGSKGMLTLDAFSKDINYLFESKQILFNEGITEIDLFSTKIDRLGYKDNSAFENHFNLDAIYDFTFEDAQTFTINTQIFINFGIYVVATLVIGFLAFKILKQDSDVLINFPNTLKMITISVLIMYLGNFISSVFTLLFKMFTNDNTITSVNQFSLVKHFSSPYRIFTVFTIIALAPVVEELVFRKAFFSVIKNQWLALAISSLFFGLIHVVNEASILALVINIIPYLIAGAALGFIYIKNKHNIWISIMAHSIVNAISVLFVLFL